MLTKNAIKNLVEDTSNSDKILSLYLNTNPGDPINQNNTQGWQIYAKNASRDIEDSPEVDPQTVKSIRSHLDTFLDNYVPDSRSLALFINERGVIESFELPLPIKNYHNFGTIDPVQLLRATDDYKSYLVVLVDREKARFLSAYPGRASVEGEIQIDFNEYDFGNKQFVNVSEGARGESPHSSGGENFEDMKNEHIRRFYDDVAGEIRDLLRNKQSDSVILGGSDKSAHRVKDLLHKTIQDRVIDILSIPVDSPEAEVAEAVKVSTLNYEREKDLSLINESIDMAKAGGRAVLDYEEVHDLLEMQQVELLILPYPMDDENQARRLANLALISGADLKFVQGSAMTHLKAEGGLVARLYYPVPEA